jgi:hypothetical protein
MSFKRFFPTKDTFIANRDGLKDISLSNMGASEILNVYRTVDNGSTASMLMSFDTVPSGRQAILKLFNAQHSETLPTEFTASITPLEQAWTEGQGHDLDYYTDGGAANWVSASAGVLWTLASGALSGVLSASTYFSTGHEDLETDISSLTSSMGFGLKIDIAASQPSGEYYIKKFHSRHTHFPGKRPFIETRWEDWSGSVLTTSSYRIGTSGAFSGTILETQLSSSIPSVVVSVTNSIVDPVGTLVADLDVKHVYFSDEVVDLHLTVRSKDYNPATVATASADAPGTVLMDAYYRVVNERTGEVAVPYGTGSVKYTKLSWNDAGNYFRIYMDSLPTGTLMRFDFIYSVGGMTSSLPGNDFTFRII